MANVDKLLTHIGKHGIVEIEIPGDRPIGQSTVSPKEMCDVVDEFSEAHGGDSGEGCECSRAGSSFRPMISELEVLGLIGARLQDARIGYMLAGFALSYYATPRMTRDLGIVIQLAPADAARVHALFAPDFYVDIDDARDAITTERMFNMLHLESGIKVDFILRKTTPYRQLEFARRVKVELGVIHAWIVNVEDLILSKLVWNRDSQSDPQMRDVRSLLAVGSPDVDYLKHWAPQLGVADALVALLT